MKVTRLAEAVKYNPPKHSDCYAMHLQHKNLGCEAPYWVGCSYYLPGGTADWDAGPLPKIYVVLEGELTMTFDDWQVKLGPMDSIYIGPGENRQVRNDTNRVATMLVVMPYPPAQA
ncbi:MAG: cupin domain-containing protein [Chloroflexi bacterium]|nr:cupin domain-containing protein [Chloroflexota bacterium]